MHKHLESSEDRDELHAALQSILSDNLNPKDRRNAMATVKRLLQFGTPFDSLEHNPFESLERRKAPLEFDSSLDLWTPLEALNTLGDFFRLPDADISSLRKGIVSCLRARCASIIDWLDFLMPSNGYMARHDKGDFGCHVISKVLALIFMFRSALSKEIAAESPRLHVALLRLWLGQADTLATLPREEINDVHARVSSALRTALWMKGTKDARGRARTMADPAYLPKSHSAFADAARVVYKRPRTLYRCAIGQVPLFLNASCDPNGLVTYFDALACMANSVLVARRPARDVVQGLVNIVRMRLMNRVSHRQAAISACMVLRAMWEAEDGDRALLVSVREGVVACLLALHREEPSHRCVSALKYIAACAVRGSIAHALSESGQLPEDRDLRDADMRAVDACLRERLALAVEYYRPTASVCCQAYLERVKHELIIELEKLEPPSSPYFPVYVVQIDLKEVPVTHHVSVEEGTPDLNEPMLHVNVYLYWKTESYKYLALNDY
ncbi:hypothetical protein K525DRAFT_270498 [Schizophyllum commune Loenen D]|nr:hypothetical protein K525DRAFT_270498 [Schizophyllum commune Loenen D]